MHANLKGARTNCPCIAVSGLTKTFRRVPALQGVSLEVQSGEIVALLGRNGAGKSTLLRILSTTVLPDGGHAKVGGHDVIRDPASVRHVVGVSLGDERSWYWRLTGRRNLEFFAILHGLTRREARARADELLREVDLVDAADRRFDGYSSGMRARLSLARALINRPSILLLDEPTRNLDPLASAAFRETLRGLVRDRGASVLFATHNLHEAAELADEVIGVERGRISFVQGNRVDAIELEQALLAARE